MTDMLRIEARESMFVVDGGIDAELPPGFGGPVLAGEEAVFIAGRVAADAPTVFRIGSSVDSRLIRAYEGQLASPAGMVRVVNVMGDLLGQVHVSTAETPFQIYLSNLAEPDEILVVLDAGA